MEIPHAFLLLPIFRRRTMCFLNPMLKTNTDCIDHEVFHYYYAYINATFSSY